MSDETTIDNNPSGKFDDLTRQSDNNRYKLSGMFREWFLDYASYVILERAVPHIGDGLKPVQRRILHAMKKADDGRYTKVASLVGEAMKYHPHGDASIGAALVQLGQKNLLIDCQGNWGNIITGDPNAAPRYIEARLTKFANEILFNPKTTEWMNSYDGRNQEPVELPAKFPLLLAQGAEGIAVGLASKILPHNFNDLIDASIACLKGKDFELYPDFPTGGTADCSKYNKGSRGGSVRVRVNIEKLDKKTLVIREVPYGKTVPILIDSILKANDSGKIKIKKVENFSTKVAEIVIHLNNDVSPDKTIDALYAFTDCETSISPNMCVIKDDKPFFTNTDELLRYNTEHTRDLLGKEIEIRLGELENEWHYSSLEKIFFEKRVYKILEKDDARTWEEQLGETFEEMNRYRSLLRRDITMEDIGKLVEKPVRKISKFDVKAVDEKIKALEQEMEECRYNLEHITEFTIKWYENLKKKYGKDHPRMTRIANFENIEVSRVRTANAKLYVNRSEGFIGTGLKKEDNGEYVCDCSDMDEIIVFMKNGKYIITKVQEKAFIGKNIIYAAVFNRNDTRTIYNAVYRDGKAGTAYAKRFAVGGITRDKEYDLTQGTPDSSVLWFTANPNGEAETLKVYFKAKAKLKKLSDEFDFASLAIKGRAAMGNILTKNQISRIVLKSKGTSTIGGKSIWFDQDINRLNEDSRGKLLGEFSDDDRILAICKDGTFYTTNYDLSNRYQGDLLIVEKLDVNRTFTVIYFDGEAGSFYIKRFGIDKNQHGSFIPDKAGSYLVAVSEDERPRIEIVFGGKNSGRAPEIIDAETFIGKKLFTAKGKRATNYIVDTIGFTDPAPASDPVTDSDIAPDTSPVPDTSLMDAPEPDTVSETGDTGDTEAPGDEWEGTLF